MKSLRLSNEEQVYWMKQHIRTRVYAAMASRQFIRELQQTMSSDPQRHGYLERVFHATWEGQHAAMRWLIEFVGVERSMDSDVVSITDFEGGSPIARDSKDYAELKRIWVACSKATSHPTIGKHADIKEPVLHEAGMKIVKLLTESIYAKAGIDL